MKILLGIPTNRNVKAKTVKCLLDLVVYSRHIDRYPVCDFEIVIAEEGYTIAENRNYIASQAIKKECDYVLMVDDDMTFPKDTLEKLLETKKRIVGVLSYSRMLPLKPTVVPVDKISDSLFECKEVGGGVLLIDVKVFNEIPQPWFDVETYPFGMIKVGEDAFFCHKAIDNKISVWCDGSIPIGHIGDYIFQR